MARVAYSKPSLYTPTFHSSRYQSRAWDSTMSSTSSGRKHLDSIQSSGYGQSQSKVRSRSFSTDRVYGSTSVGRTGGGRVQEMTSNYQQKVYGQKGAAINDKYSTEQGSYGSYITTTNSYSPSYKPPSGTRRLPPGGPGYHDAEGRKLATRDAISDVSSRITSKKGPVRATREEYDPKDYRGNSPRPSSRGLDQRFENMGLNDPQTRRHSNLIQSRKYSSTNSILSTSRETITSEAVSPLPYGNKPSTYTHTINLTNDSTSSRSKLPHLSDSKSSSISRDNSLEGSSSVQLRGRSSSVEWYDNDHPRPQSHQVSRRVSDVRENGIDMHSMFKPDINHNQGLIGLANIGNTCFMNSVTQCLSNTRPLLDYFASSKYKSDLNCDKQGSLTVEFAKVVAKLWDSGRKTAGLYSSNSFTARDFKSVVSRQVKKFRGNDQHDAQEFLVYLIQGLHEETNSVKGKKKKVMLGDDWDTASAEEKGAAAWNWYLSYDNSFFVSTFVGQLKSTLECMECGYKSNTFDPFWDISLPIRKLRSYGTMQLEECFRHFTEKEKLDGNESPTCERCKKRQQCTKGLTIWRFPRILILELKRFEQHFSSSRATKLNTKVDFPKNNLDLSPYTDCRRANVHPVYNLYAVVKHSGTPSGGHYTAAAKHPYSKEWHTFNDASVSTLSENRVCDAGAYVLFYELADSHSKL